MTVLPVSESAFNALACLSHDVGIPKAMVVERLLAAAIITLYCASAKETGNERKARFDCLFPDGFRHIMNNKKLGGIPNEDEDEKPVYDPA